VAAKHAPATSAFASRAASGQGTDGGAAGADGGDGRGIHALRRLDAVDRGRRDLTSGARGAKDLVGRALVRRVQEHGRALQVLAMERQAVVIVARVVDGVAGAAGHEPAPQRVAGRLGGRAPAEGGDVDAAEGVAGARADGRSHDEHEDQNGGGVARAASRADSGEGPGQEGGQHGDLAYPGPEGDKGSRTRDDRSRWPGHGSYRTKRSLGAQGPRGRPRRGKP
jgi:hypothetical protein